MVVRIHRRRRDPRAGFGLTEIDIGREMFADEPDRVGENEEAVFEENAARTSPGTSWSRTRINRLIPCTHPGWRRFDTPISNHWFIQLTDWLLRPRFPVSN